MHIPHAIARAARIGRRARPLRSPRPAPRGLFALSCLLLVAGCSAPAQVAEPPPGAPSAGAGASGAAAGDSARIVLEVRLRRSAELNDSRGALRVFDQDLQVEYRERGRGPGLDAGEVAADGRPMVRAVSGKGAVSYRLGRDPSGTAEADGEPWVTIAWSGGPRLAPGAARVKLAPFPLVTRPAPREAVQRTEDLNLVMLPPVPDVWYRVTLDGAGDPVTAIDLGEGRWVFPGGALARLASGRARILIEVETSCGDCPGPGSMRTNWSGRSELEIPVTLL